MSIWKSLGRVLEDPAPAFVFELSESGIAWARTQRRKGGPPIGFQPLDPDVLSVSPLKDNLQRPEALTARVRAIATEDARKQRRAAVILPDYSGRVAVLDFDAFPSDPAEQLSLVRFRIKKSVPFDVEAAAIGYHAQPHSGNGKRLEVVVAVVALDILARYEAAFRAAGLQPGYITTSTLAALDLLHNDGVAVAVKLSGRVLSVAVVEGRTLRLIRCLELADVSAEEIMAVLYPTFAYVEDEVHAKPQKMLLCGFGPQALELGPRWEAELGVPVEPLRSRFGALDQFNAGLLGYLEALHE